MTKQQAMTAAQLERLPENQATESPSISRQAATLQRQIAAINRELERTNTRIAKYTERNEPADVSAMKIAKRKLLLRLEQLQRFLTQPAGMK
jgi:vacuolar-type H+-ATPase subunit I/STV1